MINLFFVIGSFAFLFWYMPLAVSDGMITLAEIATIGINILCFLLNVLALLVARKSETK